MQQRQYWDEISLFIFVMIFPLFFGVFIEIHEYANMVHCMFDHGMKSLCLSFILVQILVIYD